MAIKNRSHSTLLASLLTAALSNAFGFGCQARAMGIVYVGDDRADAAAGGTGDAGSGGAGEGGTSGSGVGAMSGSGGARDGGPDSGGSGGLTDAGADAEPDADVPDADTPDGDVPPTEHCKPVADWATDLAAKELELFDAVNEQRDLGAICDGTSYKPTPALILQPILRCSARLHTQDMVKRAYFSLFNPEGEDPQDRMRAAGWQHPMWGENIFHDNDSAAAVVAQWIAAGGDQCRNIVDARHGSIGVGRFGNKWTIDLGTADGGTSSDAGLQAGE